jgi:hypothetical protein
MANHYPDLIYQGTIETKETREGTATMSSRPVRAHGQFHVCEPDEPVPSLNESRSIPRERWLKIAQDLRRHQDDKR